MKHPGYFNSIIWTIHMNFNMVYLLRSMYSWNTLDVLFWSFEHAFQHGLIVMKYVFIKTLNILYWFFWKHQQEFEQGVVVVTVRMYF